MEQLLKADSSWKYFFNSIGTALPGMPVQVSSLFVRSFQFKAFDNLATLVTRDYQEFRQA